MPQLSFLQGYWKKKHNHFVKFRTLEPGVLSPHSALVGAKKSTSEENAGEYWHNYKSEYFQWSLPKKDVFLKWAF